MSNERYRWKLPVYIDNNKSDIQIASSHVSPAVFCLNSQLVIAAYCCLQLSKAFRCYRPQHFQVDNCNHSPYGCMAFDPKQDDSKNRHSLWLYKLSSE